MSILSGLIRRFSRKARNPRIGPDGEQIIEGDRELTYLKFDKKLGDLVTRLRVLDVVVIYGQNQDQDLVTDLYGAYHRCHRPELTQVNQYLASKTLDMLVSQKDRDIKGHTFIMGAINPLELTTAKNTEQYIKILTQNYPDYRLIAEQFETTKIFGENFDGMEFNSTPELEKYLATNVIGLGEERSKKLRYALLRMIADDFAALGEPVSYRRLKFLNPYLRDLANRQSDRRRDCIRKMLHHEYPFHQENRDNWFAVM